MFFVVSDALCVCFKDRIMCQVFEMKIIFKNKYFLFKQHSEKWMFLNLLKFLSQPCGIVIKTVCSHGKARSTTQHFQKNHYIQKSSYLVFLVFTITWNFLHKIFQILNVFDNLFNVLNQSSFGSLIWVFHRNEVRSCT